MLDLRCHFIGMFCRFVVMLLSFICHLFVILGMENAKKYT